MNTTLFLAFQYFLYEYLECEFSKDLIKFTILFCITISIIESLKRVTDITIECINEWYSDKYMTDRKI